MSSSRFQRAPAHRAARLRQVGQQPVSGCVDVRREDHDLLFEFFERVGIGERVECRIGPMIRRILRRGLAQTEGAEQFRRVEIGGGE